MTGIDDSPDRRTGTTGVIDRYRSWLPVTEATPVITLGEGSTPLVARAGAVGRAGLRGLAEGRGRQPHRVVQGPRDDRRGQRLGRRGCPGGGLCLHRQHLGVGGRVRLPRRAEADRAAAGRPDRGGQAGPGDRARRAGGPDRGQLRRLPASWPARWPRAIRWRWSTRSTRSGSRARRPPPSRSSTTSATRRTCTCCRSATAATSRPTGGATSSTPTPASPPAGRGCGRFQAAGAAPLVLGHPVPDPETVATAIRIGDPASTTLAVAAKEESGGRFEAVTDDEILAAQGFLAAREGVFVEPASAAGVAGLSRPASAGRSTPASRSWSP